MNDTIIDKLYEDNKEILVLLDASGDVSSRSILDNNFKKVLLLSAASYFEYEITSILTNYICKKTNNNPLLLCFFKKKAIERQFHTYFKWEKRNANHFFYMFGEDFKKEIELEIKDNPHLDNSVKAFLDIGLIRNNLVHNNFADYPLDKTSEEIYSLYKEALKFIEYISKKLPNYVPSNAS